MKKGFENKGIKATWSNGKVGKSCSQVALRIQAAVSKGDTGSKKVYEKKDTGG